MQSYRRSLFDGLFVGAATLATSGIAGWMKPDQSGAAIAGGSVGAGVATAYISRKHIEQEKSRLDKRLQADLLQHNEKIEQQLKLLRNEFIDSTRIRQQQSDVTNKSNEFRKLEQKIQEVQKQLSEIINRAEQQPRTQKAEVANGQKKIEIQSTQGQKETSRLLDVESKPLPIKKKLQIDLTSQNTEEVIQWFTSKKITVEHIFLRSQLSLKMLLIRLLFSLAKITKS